MSRKKRKEKLPIIFLCPCCDYISLAEWGCNKICPICFWENDGLYLDQTQSPSPANGMLTLVQARANFQTIGACDGIWKAKVCSLEERSLYQYIPRHNETLLLKLLSKLGDLGIATARASLFGNLITDQLDELDEGLSAYDSAADRRGFVVYNFRTIGVNDFIGPSSAWVISKPAVTDDILGTIEQLATAIGLLVEIEFTDLCPGADIWTRSVFNVSENQKGRRRSRKKLATK